MSPRPLPFLEGLLSSRFTAVGLVDATWQVKSLLNLAGLNPSKPGRSKPPGVQGGPDVLARPLVGVQGGLTVLQPLMRGWLVDVAQCTTLH